MTLAIITMFCNPDRISGSKLGGINLARRRKRKSRRRQEGRKLLEHIPQFSIDSALLGDVSAKVDVAKKGAKS